MVNIKQLIKYLKENGSHDCVRSAVFSDFDWLLIVIGIAIVVLLSIGALLVRYKKCGKTMVRKNISAIIKLKEENSMNNAHRSTEITFI